MAALSVWQREVEARVLPVRFVNRAVMVRSGKVAGEKPAGRGQEIHQLLDSLVAAGSRLARVVEARVRDDQAGFPRGKGHVGGAEPASIWAALAKRQGTMRSRL